VARQAASGDSRQRPGLLRPLDEAKELISTRIAAGLDMASAPIGSTAELETTRRWFYTWDEGNAAMLRSLLTTDKIAEDYSHEFFIAVVGATTTLAKEAEDLRDDIRSKVRKLEGVIEQLKFIPENVPPRPTAQPATALDLVQNMLVRFDRVVRRLRQRRSGRVTFVIEDEYDVQDLLGALLRIDFDDVRPEEWTPSYAGRASRMDYLLADHNVVIETKMTRRGLSEGELGDELTVDIARYRAHPEAKTLICFVYDPDGHIGNPAGLRKDLEALGSGDLRVVVVISPTF